MDKKRFVIFSTASVLVSSLFGRYARAVPDEADSADSPVKIYEHKNYKTAKDAIKAQQEGKTTTSWIWLNMGHEDKIALIDGLKRMFKEKADVAIEKPSAFYVNMLDELLLTQSGMIDKPLGALFKTVAIMSYDFDEGVDKEETAKKYLKDQYEEFKELMQKGSVKK